MIRLALLGISTEKSKQYKKIHGHNRDYEIKGIVKQ